MCELFWRLMQYFRHHSNELANCQDMFYSVFQITASLSARSRQLWRRTGNFSENFLQSYVYDLRFKAGGLTTFLSFEHCFTTYKLTHMATQNLANIGSGNGQLPDSTKPLPEAMFTIIGGKPLLEPMLTHRYVTIYGVSMPQWVKQQLMPWGLLECKRSVSFCEHFDMMAPLTLTSKTLTVHKWHWQ